MPCVAYQLSNSKQQRVLFLGFPASAVTPVMHPVSVDAAWAHNTPNLFVFIEYIKK